MLNFSIPFARWPEILHRGCKSGTETKREVWLLRTGFGIAVVNKLVSTTGLLWALRNFPIFTLHYIQQKLLHNRNHNRIFKLEISTAPIKAKSWEPAYSQAFIQNKIKRQQVRSRESDGYGGWCLELRRGER